METITLLILINTLLAIGLQVFFPKLRHFLMAAGAFIGLGLSTLNGESLHDFFALLPLDVLAILLALELYGDIVIESRIFETMTKWLAKVSRGKGWLIIVAFSTLTYLVSCFMDNYQCLLLLIPPMLGLLRQIKVTKRYLQLIFGLLIVTSNLGGASTPIGDFPALYMLSQGIIDFNSYLSNATPLLLIAITLCIGVAIALYPLVSISSTPDEEKASVIFTRSLYRNIKIDWKILTPSLLIFIGMSFFWVKGFDATKVAIGGFLLLGIIMKFGFLAEQKIREKKASTFLYYLFLFIIVVSIQRTGLLNELADYLMQFKDKKQLMLVLFITVTTLVTGVVSAGPSTVAMFPVIEVISPIYPEHMVISCFVLSICAGSSLFLTSATAGPLMSQLTDQYEVMAEGSKYSYTFKDYLIPGFIGASIIYAVNLSYVLINL